MLLQLSQWAVPPLGPSFKFAPAGVSVGQKWHPQLEQKVKPGLIPTSNQKFLQVLRDRICSDVQFNTYVT